MLNKFSDSDSIKSVCTVFTSRAYKCYTPTVIIDSDAHKFSKEAKYLGFTFNDSKCDDSDIIAANEIIVWKP